MSEETSPFGKLLKEARLEKGLSLEEVSAEIKINLKLLRNIEDSNLEALPKRAFTKGLLRSYASFLSVPIEEVLYLYNANFEPNTSTVSKGILKNSDAQDTVFISDVFQKTIMPLSVLILTVLGVFAISHFLKDYNPTTTFSNTETIETISNTTSIKTSDNAVNAEETSTEVSKVVEKKEKIEEVSFSPTSQLNVLTVEPLDKTALLIKTNLDDKPVRASLKPNKTRIFKFETAEIQFLDAGAVNLLLNGKDIGVPGNFGEVKTVQYPSKETVIE